MTMFFLVQHLKSENLYHSCFVLVWSPAKDMVKR
jgi:hypothetical protein